MRSAEYVRGEGLVVVDTPDPRPGPGQVRLEISHVGICGTDLHLLHGAMDHRTGQRRVIGHEASGVVVEAGPGVDLAVGTHTALLPVASCGTCPACLAGHGHVCPRLVFLGIDASGAMSESMVVDASLLVPVDASVPHEHGALVEPTAVAVHDVRRSGIQAEARALVVGAGPIGALIAVVAREEGAHVVLVEPDGFRRRTVADLGFEVLDPEHDDVVALVHERTGGTGAEVAFEVSGAPAGVAAAIGVLKVRGTLALVAVHPQPREVDLHQFFWRELSLVGARLYDRSDFETAAELLARGVVPAEALVSRVVPLEDAARAAAALQDRDDVMKVLVACRG